MIVVCPLHRKTNAQRLDAVRERMRALGAPILRGHIDEPTGVVLLREGTHRIHAAAIAGQIPRIIPVAWWRSRQALLNARVAATRRGITFERIEIIPMTKRPTTDLTSWPEGALRASFRQAQDREMQVAIGRELDRRTQKPWLTGVEKIIFAVNLLAVLGLASIAFWLSGCSFPSEGTGPIACEDCYRPPHPGPFPSSKPNNIGPDDTGSSDAGDSDAESSTTAEPDGTSEGSSSTTWEGTEESSTGEAPIDHAHCDMTCPVGDALQPTPEQAQGSFGGCYCASPCATDDDCGAYEWCDPFFSRCTVACMSADDCMPIAMPPGSMVCDLWWNDADHFTHFCSYWNEDAP